MGSVQRGLVQVYTGNGKGKTTAALGQALRAIGHGWRVYMVQFMKGSREYGELTAARHLPGLTIVQSGLPTFVRKGSPGEEDVRLAREGMRLAREAINGGQYELVILDEINVAVDYGLVPLEEVLELLRQRPPHVNVILTGRYAAPALAAEADLVSEVLEIKHHYHQGVQARAGIEY